MVDVTGFDDVAPLVAELALSARRSPEAYHCSCCFGVLSGNLRETWYRAISDTHAVPVADELRRPGYVGCMLASGPNLHGMASDDPDEAISIHVYGYDHRTRSSSVDRTYEVAAS